jgi:hypothetical protein
LFTHSALAQPTVEDFYRGKQVNLIVGYGPGGGTTWSRASWRAISAATFRAIPNKATAPSISSL